VYFSSKISHSVLTYLEDQGEDLTVLMNILGSHFELLRDPSTWIAAPEMEFFLEKIEQTYPVPTLDGSAADLLTRVGHKQPSLHAWGVLDSVLKMMTKPTEIFVQPQRFMSYFVSPEPPLEKVVRTEEGISFDWPLPSDQYPHVTAYMKAAFEALPTYMGQGLGTCAWNDIHLDLRFPASMNLLSHEDLGHQISPQLLQNVVEELQKNQRDLEEKNRELQRKNEELLQYSQNLQGQGVVQNASLPRFEDLSMDPLMPGHKIGQNVARLHDYLVRAQQLITMIMAEHKANPAVKEAMRRMDWDYVKASYPRTIAETVEALRQIQSRYKFKPTIEEREPHV
jgi:hypothetical protein